MSMSRCWDSRLTPDYPPVAHYRSFLILALAKLAQSPAQCNAEVGEVPAHTHPLCHLIEC